MELDGKPLEGGILEFSPDEAKGNTARVSCTSPVRNGTFELKTSAVERSGTGAGAPLGWYKVTVRVNLPGRPPIFPGQPVIDVASKYLDVKQTPLAVEVVDSPQPGAYDLKLTSK